MARTEAMEDVYPLSPLQRGLLFHAVHSPASGAYVEQLDSTLAGPLDPALLRAAWERTVERHAVLRTSFHWEEAREPVQVVHRQVRLPWREEDLSPRDAAQREAHVAAFLAADRERGFVPARAPLMRVACFRLEPGLHRIVWTHHHLLLDGWSWPLVIRDVFAFHESLRRGAEPVLPAVRPYAEYIDWLSAQDLAPAEVHWRQALAGFTTPTPLPVPAAAARAAPAGAGGVAGREGARRNECERVLDAGERDALERGARALRITPATLVHAAWALLLGGHAGLDDVVFGTVVAGRPPALRGVETMVGLFINSVPLRVHLDPDLGVGPWLQGLHRQLAELRRFEHAPLASIQAWSDVPRGVPLFDSLMAFENFPRDGEFLPAGSALRLVEARFHERVHYPLSLNAAPGREWMLRLGYDPARLDGRQADRLL
ncbi:MAG: condensation domain-containing protein, partial [Candidatus Eisenbacteria bacterium]